MHSYIHMNTQEIWNVNELSSLNARASDHPFACLALCVQKHKPFACPSIWRLADLMSTAKNKEIKHKMHHSLWVASSASAKIKPLTRPFLQGLTPVQCKNDFCMCQCPETIATINLPTSLHGGMCICFEKPLQLLHRSFFLHKLDSKLAWVTRKLVTHYCWLRWERHRVWGLDMTRGARLVWRSNCKNGKLRAAHWVPEPSWTRLSLEFGINTLPPIHMIWCGACLIPMMSHRGPGNHGRTAAGPQLNLVVGAHQALSEMDARGVQHLDRCF